MTQILVVDDDEPLRVSIAILLERHGFHVLQASNGNHALQLLAAHEIDIVLTDIMMPEADGLELMLRLRGARSKTQVIAMTGYPYGHGCRYLDIAKRFGAVHALEKPFSLDDLLAKLRDLGIAHDESATPESAWQEQPGDAARGALVIRDLPTVRYSRRRKGA